MENQDRRIAVIVLNWNNLEASKRCLHSLDDKGFAVYLADNGSTDGSREALKALCESRQDTTFIDNGANLGFAAGCNEALRAAYQHGHTHFLLLNNDCIVEDRHLAETLGRTFTENPQVGIVGGKILFWPDTTRIWSTGGFVSFWGAETHIGHRELDRNQYLSTNERTFISGAFMGIARAVIDRIGFLPDAYFFGKEEWEYSKRAKQAGFDLFYNSNLVVYHEASNSHEWTDPFYVYNGTLSKILFKRRNHSTVAFAVWFTMFSVYVRYFLKFRYAIQKKNYVQGISPETIQWSMAQAVADATRTYKIDAEKIAAFRKKYADLVQASS